jgi:hypothetical protein
MAKKETTKKTTKKATSKKATSKEVIEEVATSIIENSESVSATETEDIEKIEVRPEILEKIKFDEAALENLKKVHETTVVEQDPPIEKVEVVNGDPAVVIPSNEIELNKDLTLEIEKKAFRDTFKGVNNNKSRIDRSFGYSWNGMEMD